MTGSNDAFVIAAYAVTWVVLLGYLWRLLRKGAAAQGGHGPDNGLEREAGR